MSHSTPATKDDSKQPEKKVVLELRDVYCHESSRDAVRLRGVNLSVRQGEVVMIHLGRRQNARGFASLVQGLSPTASGEVLFEQHSWTDIPMEQQFRMRSRIGRVFEDRAWINNLNVTENVTLRVHHHAFAPAKLKQHISHWTQTLRVPELTRQRPAFVEESLLQQYQWLRAIIGNPSLVILERPMKTLPPEAVEPLVEGVNKICSHDAAVIWLAGGDYEAKQAFSARVFHYQSVQGELLPQVTEGSR